MTRKKEGATTPESAGPSSAELLAALQAVTKQLETANQQSEQYREMLEQQAAANAAMKNRLGAFNPSQNPYSELMVGIRNVTDNTLGISEMNGNPAIQLVPDFGTGEPGATAVIPFAQWQLLRKSKWVRSGYIVRDDEVVGPGIPRAPEDREQDIPPEAKYNAILDPKVWIDSRTEEQIHEDLDKITSEESFQRIRRAVDDALRELESQRPRHTKEEQIKAAQWSLARLPSKWAMVDKVITERLEAPEEGEDWDEEIWITANGRGWTRKGK